MIQDLIRRPHGRFRLQVWRGAELVEEMDEDNLVVDASKLPLSRLVGGQVANNSITTIGVGTNGASPVVGNTALTGQVTKALDSVTFPSSSSVQFNFTIGANDANGVSIMEFGLLTAGGTLFARKVRASALNKSADISFTGSWTLTF